jgi:hypothetical protein
MSEKQQSNWMKFFMSISVILLATALIGLFGMFKNDAVQAEQLKTSKNTMIELRDAHKTEIKDVKQYHDKDVGLMREDISEIKGDIKTVIEDVKELLKK